MRRSLRLSLLAVLAVVSVLAAPAAAQETDPNDPEPPAESAPPPRLIDERARGDEAIRALGSQVAEAAGLNGRSEAEFRGALQRDDTLWVDETGRLLFIEDAPTPEELVEAETAEAPSDETFGDYDPADAFLLHSSPGADRVIYLDFNGHVANNTAWDQPGNNVDAQPYDFNGDPANFNDAERNEIIDIWKRVAEDYAPFAIDVTTEEPPPHRIRRGSIGDTKYGTRVVVTSTDVINCGCGGVAYLGVFDEYTQHDYYQPAYVFTSGVTTDAKLVAEAASHEVGHNLDLVHDGVPGNPYYQGHNDWAPIMGVGYYRPITQWSQGEFAGATQSQDDLAVMQINGATLRTDDHGTGPTATPLPGPDFDLTGIITTRTDVDGFSFDTDGGLLTVTVDPATVSPNLDIELSVCVVGGGCTVVDPPSDASTSPDNSQGMNATFSDTIAAGSYELLVDGVGFGNPSFSGYSDYSSLGRFRIHGTLPSGEGPPAAPTNVTVTTDVDDSALITWTDNSDNEDAFHIIRKRRLEDNSFGDWTFVANLPTDTTNYDDESVVPGEEYQFQVKAVNGVGQGKSTYSTSWFAPGGGETAPAAPTNVTVTTDVDDSALITWTDNSDNEDAFHIIRKRRLEDNSFGDWTFVANLPTDTTTWNDTGAVSGEEYRYQVKAVNGVGQGKSTYSTSWFAPGGGETAPAAPTNVTVTTDVDDSALITWTDNSDNEDAFHIIRKRRLEDNSFGDWTFVANLPTDTTTWNDTGAVSGEEYRYQVKAVNGVGQGKSTYSTSWFAP